MEGIVRDTGGPQVTLITPGGTFSFPRDSILRIEKNSDFNNLLIQGKAEETRGNYLQAITLYSEALTVATKEADKQNITDQQESAIRKYVGGATSRDPLTQGLDTVKEIEGLKQQISDAGNLALLQDAKMKMDQTTVNAHYKEGQSQEEQQNFERAITHFSVLLNNYPDHGLSRNLDRRVTKLYMSWGEQEIRKGAMPPQQLKEIFEKASKLSQNSSRAMFFLGKLAWDEKNYEEAGKYLAKVNSGELAPREQTQLSTMLSGIQRRSQPVERVVPRVVATPTPTPTPEPGMMNKLKGWISGSWSSTKSFATNLADGSADAAGTVVNLAKLAVIALVFILAFWYFPMRVLLWDLPKRRVVYNNWRKIVNYTGLIGLLFYYIDRWRREEPRKRCPACNHVIDDPEVFENYDFGTCPYCQKEIKPPFTLPEIIQGRAHGMILTKQLSSGPLDEAQREMMLYLVNLIMIHGRKVRASDIHFEQEENNLLIRYRVDGVMTESISLDPQISSSLVSSIKVVCNLNIAERRLPQDGHFRRVLLGDEVNVRVSTVPTRLGEKVVMRLLDQRIATATLDSLGMRSEALEAYRQAVKAPHGLILATGPTGSGKTTLQYASLQFINDGTKNITTVEDPIEYELEGINQIQHNQATGLTFATALRSILRQDPDVIMIGEIRDMETGSIAVNAALTGHLVFSTLHTIDTSTALSRLIDIGVDVKLLSSAILAIVAQRLVRRLCPKCRKQTTASEREMKMLGVEGRLLEGKPIFKAKGCKDCAGTGYNGRHGIYEMLVPNREIRALVERGASGMDIRQASRDMGMKTLREEGILKILQGITSVDEVIRVTTDDYIKEEERMEADVNP